MSSGAPGSSRVPPGPPPGGPPGQVPPGPPPGGPGFVAPPGMFPPMGMPLPNFPPPLPPNWSEHRAPDGVTPYYYNSVTKQSTYTRPTLAAPAAPPPAPAKEKKKKKEKPKDKVPIPGTGWMRITTNEGNVFYFEKENKRSEWTVPEEIAEAVAALEASEAAERKAKAEEARLERLREQERVRAEIAEERKRKAEAAAERKRKAAEAAEGAPGAKKAKDKKEDEADEASGVIEDEGDEQFEDEEEWKRAVTAQFDAADREKAAAEAKKEGDAEKGAEEAAKKVFAVPEKVQVSAEEGRALFKALLIEKDISPFAPWDQALPLFINDPRYVLLPSMKERRDVYEEYCRTAGRAKRTKAPAPDKVDHEKEYRALMREEVTSTRTRFDDFRRKFKKDRRFYAFGRDDREREKAFKVHLRELGERKRADAERAEKDFFELLSENPFEPGTEWSVVKKGIANDPRYDAVGSSSLRAELFATYAKKVAAGEVGKKETPEEAAARRAREKRERQEASLRERATAVRAHQDKIGEEANKARRSAGREEAERLYGSLLVDVVRDADASWETSQPVLSQDRRYAHPALRDGDRQRLFEAHVARLREHKSDALAALFAQHAALDTPFEDVYAAIADDPLVARMGLAPAALEERFAAWRRARESAARAEFYDLLRENNFVEFWGRMRNKVLDEAAAALKEQDERDEGEGLGEGGAADITALAKQVDLGEIKTILRRDRRYRQFDHVAEEREQWLRDYLENLEGSKGTETVHKVG